MKILSKEELLEKFRWVGGFGEGFARVKDLEGDEYHIKPDGSPAYPQKFRWVEDFKEGLAWVEDFEGNWFKINTKGERVN